MSEELRATIRAREDGTGVDVDMAGEISDKPLVIGTASMAASVCKLVGITADDFLVLIRVAMKEDSEQIPESRKPCPKCGSKNLIHKPVDFGNSGIGWLVACEDCGHEGPACLRTSTADYWWDWRAEDPANVKTAANLWNRRANGAATFPPQTKQEVVDEIAKRLEVSQDEKLLRIVLRMLS